MFLVLHTRTHAHSSLSQRSPSNRTHARRHAQQPYTCRAHVVPQTTATASPCSCKKKKMSERPKRATKQPNRFSEDEDGSAKPSTKSTGVQKKGKGAIAKTKATKKRKSRAPPGVKRPKTAYILYAQAVRPKVKEDNPSATFGELTKLVSQQWNELSEAEKAPYLEEAAKDKKRYEREVKAAEGGSDEEEGDGSD